MMISDGIVVHVGIIMIKNLVVVILALTVVVVVVVGGGCDPIGVGGCRDCSGAGDGGDCSVRADQGCIEDQVASLSWSLTVHLCLIYIISL